MKILKTWAMTNVLLAITGFIGMIVCRSFTPIDMEWLNYWLGVLVCSLLNLFITMAIGLAWQGWEDV